jgi:DNA-directed RNA polymerase I, II, and III subunit RPABC2
MAKNNDNKNFDYEYEDDNISEDSSVVTGGKIESDDDENDTIFSGGEDSEIEDYDNMDEDIEDKEIDKNIDIPQLDDRGSSDGEEDDDDEEEEDEDYLQKLDDHFRQKVIENHHPELKTLNYEEIETLATVVRDKDSTIIDPLHQTLPIMTRYEKARILGERAKQINMGAKPFVEVDDSMIDGYLIALKELEQKRMPFIIQRPLPNGGSEYWRISDLEILA